MSAHKDTAETARNGGENAPEALSEGISANGAEQGWKVIAISFGCICAMTLSISSIYPLIPMLSKHFDTSLSQASLIVTIYSVPGIILGPIAGLLVDRFGRKPILIPSLLLFSIGGAACSLAPDIPTMIVMRFVQGLGAIALGILYLTILADAYTGYELRRLVGLSMAAFSISTGLSPTLGGLLAHLGWQVPFLLPGLFLVLVPLAMKTSFAKPTETVSLKSYVLGLWGVLKKGRTLALLCITLLTFTMLLGPMLTGFPALADARFGAVPGVIGAMMICNAIGTGIVSSRMGALSNRFSSRRLLLVSQGFQIVGLLLIPFMPVLYVIMLPILLYGMGQGLNIPNVQAQLLQSVDTGQRGALMAVNSILQRIGQASGPIIFSAIVDWKGIDAPFFGGIVLSCIILVLVVLFIPHEPRAEA